MQKITRKKIKKSLFILLILVATFASLRVYSAVDIPDANLRAALGKGIRDLTGLKFVRNLQINFIGDADGLDLIGDFGDPSGSVRRLGIKPAKLRTNKAKGGN